MIHLFKGHVFGPLLLTWCNQMVGAPIVDRCWTSTRDRGKFKGWAIVLKFWRRDRHWRRETYRTKGGPALVVGWRQERG